MPVEIRGDCDSLGEAVIDRLISWDVDLIIPDPGHIARNALQLEYSKSEILTKGDGFSVSFDGTQADLMIGTHVIIHDMVPSRIESEMDPNLLTWFRELQMGETLTIDLPIRWWVGIADVADAIARIARAKKKTKGVEICGRREWKSRDAASEIEMLWNRTVQGISGNFDTTALQIQAIPGIVVEGSRADRPDLVPLHELLVSIDGEGWRPLTPFRSAMMVLIASLFTE